MKQILALLVLTTQVCVAQWYQQNSGTTQNLNAVTFIDANNGFVVGDSGTIIRTSNGGSSWSLVATDVTDNLGVMCFTDPTNGWVVGNSYSDSAVILHTTNGGASWGVQKRLANSVLSDIHFVENNLGFAVGWVSPGSWDYSFLLKTTDGGVTWTQFNYNSLNVPQGIHFVDANNGWMRVGGCGSDCWGDIYKTTDGGTSWNHSLFCYQLPDIQFTDFNNAIAVGYERIYGTAPHLTDFVGRTFKTTDGGNTWATQIFQDGFCNIRFRSVFFVTENIHVIVANDVCGVLSFYWTTDAGITWFPRPTDIEQHVNRAFFTDAFTGWAVGDNGTILHTTNGGVTFVEEQSKDVPTAFSLSQNYPNPFNPSTTITYDLPTSSHVTLKVYDVLGREVQTLVDGEESAGTKSVNLNAENMASGVYLYRLHAGGFVDVKKLILLK